MEGMSGISFLGFVQGSMLDLRAARGYSWFSWGNVAKSLSDMERAISIGWVKGEIATPQGMCMLGAYMYGSGTLKRRASRESEAVAGLLEKVILAKFGDSVYPHYKVLRGWDLVVFFNDLPATSREMVLEVIKEALAVAEARDSEVIREKFTAEAPLEAPLTIPLHSDEWSGVLELAAV